MHTCVDGVRTVTIEASKKVFFITVPGDMVLGPFLLFVGPTVLITSLAAPVVAIKLPVGFVEFVNHPLQCDIAQLETVISPVNMGRFIALFALSQPAATNVTVVAWELHLFDVLARSWFILR